MTGRDLLLSFSITLPVLPLAPFMDEFMFVVARAVDAPALPAH
jgi:hypothetical protein